MNAIQATCIIVLSAVALIVLLICIWTSGTAAKPIQLRDDLRRSATKLESCLTAPREPPLIQQQEQPTHTYRTTRDLVGIVQQRLRQNETMRRPAEAVIQIVQPVVINEFAYLIAQGVDAEQQRQVEQALEYERMVRNDEQVGWYQSQNVHDAGVIRTAQKVIQETPTSLQSSADQVQRKVIQMISRAACDQSLKDEALRSLDVIIENNAVTKFDALQEVELLDRVVNTVADKPELTEYFITNLSECADVCSHGRATRLVDVIAMAQDNPIVPDALIQRQLREKLQSLYNEHDSNSERTKTAFIAELQQMQQRGIIDSKQTAEYSSWADAL